ncbi:39S ribosomal protein L19, mitochondrial [Orchesella cincta]|uniref:Large ribosomal subunit protein bL19m n=1 Tax=Orchesella cincta TaxID=48709 RepID=A0A1D2MTX9_ORCCI|nr:39S ribosomal protein L19, mitochondrial [Orchesella cincta]
MLKLFRYGFAELSSISQLSRCLSIGACSRAFTSQARRDPSETDEATAAINEGERLNLESDSTRTNSNADPHQNPYKNEMEETFAPFRFVYPEFLPDPTIKWRNRVREKLERMDMLKRRSNIDIPEFYVGSILSVTLSDRNAPGKTNTFVGICIQREGTAMRSMFTLRNVVDGHGVEITFDLYNPTILNITCLRLEKRLDENLRYLRDAPPEYSTFPFDMVPELRNPDAPVPINTLKVKLNPKPWHAKWQLWDLKGVEDFSHELESREWRKLNTWKFSEGYETAKYDLMKTYRSTIPAEEQTEIYSEVHQQLAKLTASLRKQKRKRTFVKPQKTV